MLRSISEPSLGTVGTETFTNTAASHAGSRQTLHKIQQEYVRGKLLWEGRLGRITKIILLTPWNVWFQFAILLSVIMEFILHLLLAYVTKNASSNFIVIIIFGDIIYLVDVFVHLVHAFWPLVRLHMRVYRRSWLFLFYDVLSLIPLTLIFRYKGAKYSEWVMLGRWLSIGRIYRFFTFFDGVKERMRTSRKILYIIEHMMTVLLILHATSCMWFSMHETTLELHFVSGNYLEDLSSRKLKFNCYSSCWYYCACRLYNVIFGDAFPLNSSEKWLTSILMLFGFVFMRYRFIGMLAWELVLENSRRTVFVDRYHHMVNYLKLRGTQPWLLDQAKKYKQLLWEMKDGVLRTRQLKKLPQPLQMELIFDINVGYFHRSLLFRDTHESFMRQISLLMKHEIYLAGQHIWSQGVVKNGMLCVKRGVIEMLSDEDDESPMIAFKENTVLGELSLFYSIPSKVTVKAATYVELQVLRRTDFMRTISEYPAMLKHIRCIIGDRLQSNRRKQESIMKYDKGDSRLIRTRYRPMKVLKDNLVGAEEEDPTFVDDSHMYYIDENNVRLPKFTTEYLELYEVTSNVTTIDAPRICLRSNFPWILEPDTDFTYMCDLAHFLIVLYVCGMSPYSAITNRQYDAEKVLSTIVTAGLLLNLYLQLTTAIIKKNIRKVTVKEIAEVKMYSFGFYMDIISLFPIHIFTDTLDLKGESVAGQIAKLFPVLQVWHIWDYFGKWERNFNSHVKFLCLMKFFILFCIFSYWAGCFLYLFACPRTLCRENSWMALLIYWETKVLMTNNAKHEHPMMSSFSFGTSVFTGTGSSDIAPGLTDLIVVVLLFTLGTYLSCFYTAKICSLYLLSTQRKLKFKESMRELFYFLSVNHVSGKIKSRVKKFFCVQWYYNHAVSTKEIFKDMSANIQQEVLSIEMVETLLQCPLFQECNRDFLQTVAANTRTIVLPDNEIVQHAADIGRDMYILQKGHCNILDDTGTEVANVGPGSHFGVLEMLFGLPKVHTVLTSTNCILLHVEYTALVQCWGTFPDISHPIITVLEDPELQIKASYYEEAKPLTGRMDVKTNRITQEIKESFVILNSSQQRQHYIRTFDRLGVMRHLRYLFLPVCITPHGLFLKFWCLLRFIMAIYYVITVPYDVATKQHKHGRGYNWTDIYLYMDVIIIAYVAFYNERSLLVTHPLLTMSRYFKHSFLYDALSIFPFEQLVRLVNDTTDLDIYRINRLLLVTRITAAFSYWESDIMQVNPVVVLLKFLPIAATLVNFATAIIFINTCEPYLSSDSYFILANCSRVLMVNNNRSHVRYAASEYAYTFYWVYEIFVGLGCTPVGVANSVNVWLMMSLEIAGFLYFAFMIGYVSSTRSATTHSLLEHTEKTRDLANFLYQENVDPVLTSKTVRYFEYVWKRTNGSNAQQICRRLNSSLMEDTLVFMYERALREVPLFGKVERSFIRVVTQHLNEMYFLKGDTVIQCKDIQPYVYIIYRGKVDVLTSYNEMITCMGPGGMFGNFTGQPTSCSEVTIYASRSLDLLVIPSQTFFNLVKYYPKIREPLTKAFEMSRDYILPITMNFDNDTSSEDSDGDITSIGSGVDSRSGSSRFEMAGQLSTRSSHSNVSQAKSSASVMTYQSFTHVINFLRPGTLLFQAFGYVTCVMATANYATCLYELVTLNDCYFMCWIQTVFDIFFYIKILMSMHKGYISKHGELIMDASKCRKRYFKHKLWVWTDIFVALPLEILGFCSPYPVRLMHYLRANKLFRLKYLVEFYRQTSAELTNNLTVLQCAMTMIVVILLIHTFTCIWLVIMIITSPINMIRTLKMHLIDEVAPQRRWDYSTSFYIVVSVLTTTGGDEFIIRDMPPKVILAIILVCGKMLAAIVVATAMQVAYSTKYALNSYETVTKELIDMLKNQGLSDYQLEKFWMYVKQLWVNERGRQLPVLLEQTPYVRRCDLMSAMFGTHLRNCYLFADTGEAFLRQLTAALDFAIYFPGNYIVVAGDSEARMYWVNSGAVSVVSVRRDLTETTHELLGPGDVFGIMQGMNRGVTHCFSYRAESKVTTLSLSLDTWSKLVQFFPEARKLILDRAEFLFAKI